MPESLWNRLRKQLETELDPEEFSTWIQPLKVGSEAGDRLVLLAPDTRFLLRSVNGEVRGFLSDRFRRLDSRPIVDSFARVCQGVGALPVEGYVTDTKMALKAILPQVFEPVRHEVMAFGAVLFAGLAIGAARSRLAMIMMVVAAIAAAGAIVMARSKGALLAAAGGSILLAELAVATQ